MLVAERLIGTGINIDPVRGNGNYGIGPDAATALLSSIMIGVGVDFTVRYLWCFNIQVPRGMYTQGATRTAIGNRTEYHN